MGDKCQHECPGRTKNSVCGGKGKCLVTADGANAVCHCEAGYGGRACKQSCPFSKTEDGKSQYCFGKGECVANGNAMKCACKKGWLGEDCSIPCPTSLSGEICSNRGMCFPQETEGKAKCECKEGFVGKACSLSCPRGDEGSICSGHGKCRAHGNSAVCKCHKDFTGGTCSKGCPKDKDGTICSGFGRCALKDNMAQCECNVGHTGKHCENRVCGTENSLFDEKTSRCLCEPGYTCCSAKKLSMLMSTESESTATVQSLEEFE
jgi:fibrillin 1